MNRSEVGRDDIIKRFLESGRTGFYFAVLKEGEVGAGDSIEMISRDVHKVRSVDSILTGRMIMRR